MSSKATLIIDIGFDTLKYGITKDEPNAPQYVIKTDVLDHECLSVPFSNSSIRFPTYKPLNYSCVIQLGLKLYPQLDPKESILFLCQPYERHKENKIFIAEIAFEQFSFSGVYFGLTNLMSLYSYGLLSGGVLESGASSTNYVPIYEGKPLDDQVEISKITGHFLNNALQFFLRQSGKPLNDFFLLEYLKEKACIVSDRLFETMIDRKEENFQLPDGRTIAIGKEARKCPEVLFCPTLGLINTKALHRLVVDGLENVAKKYQDNRVHILVSNTVLTGGNVLFPNFENRFQHEVKSAPSVHDLSHSCFFSHPNPVNAPWRGGSIVAKLSSFETNMVVRKEEFIEKKEKILM